MRRALLLGAALAWAAPLPAQGLRISVPLDSLAARVRADSLDPVAHYNLALGLLSHERWDAADSALRRSTELDPRFALAHLALSVAQDQHDDFWKALRRRGGDSAIAAERRRRDAEGRLAYQLDPFVNPQILVYSGRLPRGERIFLGIAAYPSLYELAEGARGRLLARMAQPIDDSLPPGLLWVHGLASEHTDRWDEAIRDYNALLRVWEVHEQKDSLPVPMVATELRYALAAQHQRAGDRVTAMSIYTEVAAGDLGNFMAHVQLAKLHEDGGEWSQAVQERRRAIQVNPDDPTLVRDLGVTLLHAGRAAEADSVLSDLSAAHPLDWNTLYHLGMARQARGHNAEAAQAYRAFLALVPRRLTNAIADARERLAAVQQ